MFIVIHTQYIISVQPSLVITWKTVNIPAKMLSKFVIPSLGPGTYREQTCPSGQPAPPWFPHIVDSPESSTTKAPKCYERKHIEIDLLHNFWKTSFKSHTPSRSLFTWNWYCISCHFKHQREREINELFSAVTSTKI